MNVSNTQRFVAVVASAFVAVSLVAAGAAQPQAAKPGAAKKGRAKVVKRLPMYYSAVVSPQQREQIYAIQAKYFAEINQLEEQLAALKQRRDAEVEAVLTAEQRAQVKQAADAAAAKRKQARKP